jgi:hypothetical protein
MSKSSPKQKIESLQGWLWQVARDNKNPNVKLNQTFSFKDDLMFLY